MRSFARLPNDDGGNGEKFKSEVRNNKANLIMFLTNNEPSTDGSLCPGICFVYFFLPDIYIGFVLSDLAFELCIMGCVNC